MIYELEVKLDVEPPVVRVLEIEPEKTTFEGLHNLLQAAYEWENSHLHGFFVKKTGGRNSSAQIGPVPPKGYEDLPVPENDEAKEGLVRWLKQPGDEALYVYDFGAGWEHRIELKAIKKAEEGKLYPRCLHAEGIAADEDSFPPLYDGSGSPPPGILVSEVNERLGAEEDETDDPDFDLLLDRFLGEEELSKADIDRLAALPEDPADRLGGDWEPEYVRGVWTDLLTRTKETLADKPWEHLHSNQLFAVEDPMLEEPVFVSVLGSGGQEFGVVVYYGWEGYAYLCKMFNGELTDDETMYGMTGVAVYFEDRGDLEQGDYKLIKDHGFSFRGKKQWPVFRNFEPGYVPWKPEPDEAGLLANILLAVDAVVQIQEAGNLVPEFGEGGQMLAFMETDDGEMAPEYIDVPGMPEQPEIPLVLNDVDLQRLKKLPTGIQSVEYDLFRMPGAIQDKPDERPFFPLVSLLGDTGMGIALGYDMIPSPQMEMLAQPAFAKTISKMGVLPREILLTEPVASYLKALTDQLPLKVVVADRLEKMEQLKREMLRMMRP
ncbi:plasmid pRiA4b ORF-3 family protein [Bhargavaea ullalensis]|uniref:SseB protein N-terminal domain-containing protein n=1 Tax=Bhargavaea ullalensis TaxID=1265685 RepID=A0ABV2G9M6_9BACL